MLPRTWAHPEGPGVVTTGPNFAGRKQESDRTTRDGLFICPVTERDIAVGDGTGNTSGGTTFERYNGKPFGCWGCRHCINIKHVTRHSSIKYRLANALV